MLFCFDVVVPGKEDVVLVILLVHWGKSSSKVNVKEKSKKSTVTSIDLCTRMVCSAFLENKLLCIIPHSVIEFPLLLKGRHLP